MRIHVKPAMVPSGVSVGIQYVALPPAVAADNGLTTLAGVSLTDLGGTVLTSGTS